MFKYLFIWLAAASLTTAYWISGYYQKKEETLRSSFLDKQKHIEATENNYRVTTDVVFENLVNTPEVLEMLARIGSGTPEEQERIRKRLYRHFEKPYENLKALANIRQLHFHYPDGRSFLRMHRPNKFGDPLFDVRYSLKVANTEKRFVQGYEEGRIFNGYRYVYPIAYRGEHLGSVEVSVSIAAFTNSLEKTYYQTYCFMLDSGVADQKLFKSEKGNYAYSPFGKTFMIDKEVTAPSCAAKDAMIGTIKDDPQLLDALARKAPFSKRYDLNRTGYVFHFLPVLNVQGRPVAYFFTRERSEAIDAAYETHLARAAVTLVLITLVIGIVFGLKKRQRLLELRKEELELQVDERTRALKNSLTKAHYIKNLLYTVFDVSEHLNVCHKIDRLLQECCERIVHHDYYRFAHVRLTDPEHLMSIPEHPKNATIQLEQMERFYALFEEEDERLQRLARGETIIENRFEDAPFLRPVRQYVETHKIRSLIFIPLKVDETYIGYLVIFSTLIHDLEEETIIFNELGHAISSWILALNHQQHNERLQEEKLQSYKQMIYALVDLTEKRDTYTAGHTRRVARYSLLIGKRLGLRTHELERLEEAAMLHDIGKIVTPDSILLKPGSLSKDEYHIIQDHVDTGANILESIAFYHDLKEIMHYHHERYDGSGYPAGLSGEEIPLLSRIMAVADAFDAMTTNRIYKPRKEKETALRELAEGKGSQFDPGIVEIALDVLGELEIDIETSQLPKSGSDYERMAYHFKDPLTGLYNKVYLKVLLELGDEERSFECVNIILLNNFHDFNSRYGWERGNKLLTEIAGILKEKYSDSKLFRVFGDDFVVLNYKHLEIAKEHFMELECLRTTSVDLSIEHYDMREQHERDNFIRLLEEHI